MMVSTSSLSPFAPTLMRATSTGSGLLVRTAIEDMGMDARQRLARAIVEGKMPTPSGEWIDTGAVSARTVLERTLRVLSAWYLVDNPTVPGSLQTEVQSKTATWVTSQEALNMDVLLEGMAHLRLQNRHRLLMVFDPRIWLGWAPGLRALLPKQEKERFAMLPLPDSGNDNERLVKTFCPQLHTFLSVALHPDDWQDADLLRTMAATTWDHERPKEPALPSLGT